ncbi:MAG: tetratricopeptide repeat protein [Sedimentisphaerales bacterium]|jgi:tetratricopeptide (TPR) repeat protein
MPEQVKKSLVISIYFALIVSTFLVFWQIRNFDFVNYDDNDYVSENPHVLNGLTADAVWWAFTTGHAANWHPLTWLSLALDRQLFGPSPGRIHLVNLLLHLANTFLLFTVIKKMTGALWQSAFVAALFALHPLHVESVAWISERKDVLSTFFWLLTMLAYARYVKQPGAVRYLLVLLIFAMGLMSKPMLVTLPFVLLLLDYWPLNRIKHFDRQVIYRLVWEKIPFIVFSIASSVITFLAQQNSEAIFASLALKFRIGNAFISYARYIEKMIWPSRLAVFYPNPYENVSVLYAVISAAVLLIVTILVIRLAKNHRYLVTGWFWYLGTLIPVIGFIQVGRHAMADRYTYITLTGLFIIIAWGLPQLTAKWPQRKIALGVSMVIVLTALGICAHRQVSYWKNSFVLFSHALAVTQNNYIAYNNLGIAYVDLGRWSEAIDNCKQAIKIKPNLAESHVNLGIAYSNLGRWPEAIDAYKQAIKIKPDSAKAYYNLGVAYGELGRSTEAIEAFKQAILIKSDYAKAHLNLGVAYGKLGRLSEAIEAFKQAIKIKPDYVEAHKNLGTAYLAVGDKNSAMAEYNILKSLNSQFANDLLNQINK